MAKNKIDGKFINKICESKLEYLLLASLISADDIFNVKDAEKKLAYINEFEKAVDDATVPDDKKQEIKDYLIKGKDILKGDIDRYNKEKNK